MKRLYVSEEVWEKLQEMKLKRRARSVDQVLKELLGLPSGKGEEEETEEAVKPSPPPPPARFVSSNVDWVFCPECLSIYAFEGQVDCPKCGAGLISLRTEEGRQLYQRLKAERREKGV